jgi:ADP-ribose pyrophosphatase YjhB (NUDIX family)
MMRSFNRWLDWCSKLQATAQNGLAFARDPYDVERYTAVRAIAAEMLAAGSGLEIAALHDLLEKDSGYATPKVDVRGVVFRDGKLLLVRERSDGGWTVPGGWADVGESPAENVVREVYEESGFQTRAVKLLAVFDRSKHPHTPRFPFHVYKMFIGCEMTGGAAAPSRETAAVGFFGETEIPALSISRITPWQIARLFEHHRNPEAPTDFDQAGGAASGHPTGS